MNDGILRHINLIFLAGLVVAIAAVAAYQILWIDPAKRCEAAGDWWDADTRECGRGVYLPDITHRPIGSKVLVYPGLPRSREDAAAAGSGPVAPATKPGAR